MVDYFFLSFSFPPNKTAKRQEQEQLALPEALKPVSQTVHPFWPRRVFRSSWVTAPEQGGLGAVVVYSWVLGRFAYRGGR